MIPTGNTILITGGGTGIGRGLADSFYRLGNQVINTGRTKRNLDETTAANPGMASFILDVTDETAVTSAIDRILRDHPALNVLVNNAGISIIEDLRHSTAKSPARAIVETNLIAPIALTAALMPHLQTVENAAIMFVSSGLAFVPNAGAPTYCATKAALHSYAQSLRYQLKNSKMQVLELIPPYVRTTLGGARQAVDPHAMPLDEYVAETMEILTTRPEVTEICVERVLQLRNAAYGGPEAYRKIYLGYNDTISTTARS